MVNINIEVAKDGSILPAAGTLSKEQQHRMQAVFDRLFNSCSYINQLLYKHNAEEYWLHKVERGNNLQALYFFVNMKGKASKYTMSTYGTPYEALVALSQNAPNMKYRKKVYRVLEEINSEMFSRMMSVLI